MKPRETPLTVPDSPRYWVVDLAPRGAHHFRFPTFSRASRVLRLVTDHRWEEQTATAMGEKAPALAAVVGACWFNRGLALDADYPTGPNVSDEALWAYGEAVCDELIDLGYSLIDLSDLFAPTLVAMQERLLVISRAQDRADFSSTDTDGGVTGTEGASPPTTQAVPAVSTSSPQTSASP